MSSERVNPPMRLLIDCSLVDFSALPTGISRITMRYFEIGYVWSQRHRIEVIPVVPMTGGGVGCPAHVRK